MNRPDLFRAVEFARAAAHNATLAASFDKINPTRAAAYRRLSEDAFYAGIEALFEADLTTTRPDVMKALAPIIEVLNPAATAAQPVEMEKAA